MSTRKPFGQLSLHVAKGSGVDCLTYVARTPILNIRAGSMSVAVSLASDEITDDAVAFARDLASQARLFAAEVERLHAVEAGNAQRAA